jgi:hypothetical protein
MYKEKIVDALTGEITWRDYTEKEIQEVEAAQAAELVKSQEQAERLAAKAVAQAKLEALGLTIDDLKALGL